MDPARTEVMYSIAYVVRGLAYHNFVMDYQSLNMGYVSSEQSVG